MSAAAFRRTLAPYFYLAPAIIVLGIFFLGSFAQVVQYSFGSFNPFTQTFTFTGLDNYQTILSDAVFWRTLANSFLYLLVTPVLIALSLACALIIDSGIRGKSLLRFLFFLPVITPTIVAAIGWRILYNEDSGLLTSIVSPLAAFLGTETPNWLTDRPWTLISPMTVTLWKGFGFYMMMFLAALLNVPSSLKEAAAIDGAGRVRTFMTVTLPAIWPVMTLVIIISSISALKVFDEIFVTVQGVNLDHKAAVPYIYETAFIEGSFGVASAAGVVLFLILLVFSMINLKATGGNK